MRLVCLVGLPVFLRVVVPCWLSIAAVGCLWFSPVTIGD